jgi:hypothetical protein
MEKLYCNFKHLVFVNLHHHDEISKTKVAHLDILLIVHYCKLEPHVLIFKKLTIKISYSSGQHLKHGPWSFFDVSQHLLNIVIIIGNWDKFIELSCNILEHENEFYFLFFVLIVYFQTSNLNQTAQCMVSQVVTGYHHNQLVDEICTNYVIHWNPA